MLSKRFILFVILGGINTIVTYVMYLLLVAISPYLVAYTVTFVLGIFLSYWLNATFVFRRPLQLRAALQYPVVYAVQYACGVGLLYLAVESLHMSKSLAPLAVVVATLPLTYVLSRMVIMQAR